MNIRFCNIFRVILLPAMFFVILFSCKKEDQHFDNPYAGGKKPLGIALSMDLPSPESGTAGSLVSFKATGLLPYKDSLTMYINGEKADVTEVDSNSIEIKVPETASTGVASLTVGDQIFFGPLFRVEGNLVIDSTFEATVGADRGVNDFLRLPDGRIILVGSFFDFNHKGSVKPFNHIVMVSPDGAVDNSLNAGMAADGGLNAIAALPNGKIVIGGGLSSYDIHRGEIHNISVLNSDASLDTMVVRTFQDQDTVPSFNGGTNGTITKLFVHKGKITAIGSFDYYLQTVYDQSDYKAEKDSLITDSVRVKDIIRFFPDGSLDSSFNYDFYTHQSLQGPNGPVHDAYMQDDGKLIIVGNFSQYNGEDVNNIVRLNGDGSIDRSFKVGNGADDPIMCIRFSKVSHHFILAGSFHYFNGEPHNGLVMLREDGSVVESFKPAAMGSTDSYRFAQQLSNGLIIVNGYFKTYNGIHRGNFMVLDPAGKLSPGYNTTGNFEGIVRQSLETVNDDDQILVMMMGSFDKFGQQTIGNITRLLFKQ